MTAGIRTSTTTDWLPNVGIAPSCCRTGPGRTSRFCAFCAPGRSPRGKRCLVARNRRPVGAAERCWKRLSDITRLLEFLRGNLLYKRAGLRRYLSRSGFLLTDSEQEAMVRRTFVSAGPDGEGPLRSSTNELSTAAYNEDRAGGVRHYIVGGRPRQVSREFRITSAANSNHD